MIQGVMKWETAACNSIGPCFPGGAQPLHTVAFMHQHSLYDHRTLMLKCEIPERLIGTCKETCLGWTALFCCPPRVVFQCHPPLPPPSYHPLTPPSASSPSSPSLSPPLPLLFASPSFSLEWWCFELLLLIAGWLPNPEVEVAAMAVG